MNRSILDDLQQHRCYPSVSVLVNTTNGAKLTPAQLDAANRLVTQADGRLRGDVDDAVRRQLIDRLTDLLAAAADQPATQALALFVSPDRAAVVPLGRTVAERVTIDDTFATRDLVADLNRTTLYRALTISERMVRLLDGDRERLVERRDDDWPMVRPTEHSDTAWTNDVVRRVADAQGGDPRPVVVAGVQRSVRELTPDVTPLVGVIAGNHDRTSAGDLHAAAWPLVEDWLGADATTAMERLEDARSANRYAGGISEIWPLAHEGRVATLVVEHHYAVAARIDAHHQVHPAADATAPDVVDDVVDDTIEAVLRNGGTTVIVEPDRLEPHGRIAAILRY